MVGLSFPRRSSCCQLAGEYDCLDATPSLQLHYRAFVATTGRSAPGLGFGISPRDGRRLCFSLGIQGLVPAVPRKSLYPLHALYTPAAVCPVLRLPTDSSQKNQAPLVLATSMHFDASSRVHSRSSLGCRRRLLHRSSEAHGAQ